MNPGPSHPDLRWVNARAVIRCGHDGTVATRPSQEWVRVDGVAVLVAHDPEGRDITACPNYGPMMKPCVTTLQVVEGYSDWLSVDGRRVVLDNLDGLTDGTVPGTVHYDVRDPGQPFVRAAR
ncbi:hypothetical protein [Actinopolymorpha pittospori]